jgi:hypothetical protein
MTMTSSTKVQLETKNSILKLLSDSEVSKLSTEESATTLMDGDEYLDLDQLAQGVQTSRGTTQPMGSLMPRKAVHASSWTKIVELLSAGVS